MRDAMRGPKPTARSSRILVQLIATTLLACFAEGCSAGAPSSSPDALLVGPSHSVATDETEAAVETTFRSYYSALSVGDYQT
jgi:hypothetical protein